MMLTTEKLVKVVVINRVLYINGDPRKNRMLPLRNAWTVNDLAREILAACADYDVSLDRNGAVFLAGSIARQTINDTTKGGNELGWD